MVSDSGVQSAGGRFCTEVGAEQAGQLIPQVQSQPSITGADRTHPDPDHFARHHELVQQVWGVVEAAGEHIALQDRSRNGGPLQLAQHLREGRQVAPGRPPNAVPGGQKAGQRRLVDGLDLFAQHGQTAPLETPEHFVVDPLRPLGPRPERTPTDPSGRLESDQRGLHHSERKPEFAGELAGGEGSVGTGVAAHNIAERVTGGFEKHLGNPDGRLYPERVTQAAGVFHRGPALRGGDPDPDDPAGRFELGQDGLRIALGQTEGDLICRQGAQSPKEIVYPIPAPYPPVFGQPL